MYKKFRAYAIVYREEQNKQKDDFSVLCVDFVRSNIEKRADECNKNSEDVSKKRPGCPEAVMEALADIISDCADDETSIRRGKNEKENK